MLSGLLPSSLRLPARLVIEAAGVWLAGGARYEVVHLDTIAAVHLVEPLREFLRTWGQRPVIVSSLNDSYSLLLGGPGLERTATRAACGLLIQRYERRWLPAADVTDVVSQRDVSWLEMRAPKAKLRLVPLGIDVRKFEGPRLASKWDVLFVGPIVQGGILRLLERMFDEAIAPVNASLGGRGSLRVGLTGPPPQDRVARAVERWPATHLGFSLDLSHLLRSSRMVVVPSDQGSGTPTKALEAMAAGTPVVGMRALLGIVGGIDHRSFSLAANMGQFSERIMRVLTDAPYAERIGEGGRSLVRRQHDWPVVLDGYLDFRGYGLADALM